MDGESKVHAIAFFITFGFDAKRLGTGPGRHLKTINNRPRTILINIITSIRGFRVIKDLDTKHRQT